MGKFAVYNLKFFPERTNAKKIVSVDDSVTSTEALMTDHAILCDVLDEEDSETEDDTDDVLMNQFSHNLVMCVKFSMYFENACYLVISFLVVYLSLLNPSLCNIASEEIVLTQTNILFLSEFALTGVSLNSNIRQVGLFSLVPWRFELPGVNCSL